MNDYKDYINISQEMKEKGQPFFDMLNINAFSVRRFYLDGTKIYLSTIPAWFQFYKKHEFYKLGEFNKVLNGYPPFKLWDYWDKNDEDFWKVINPAKSYFNQNHGLCYIRKKKTYVDILNFGADEKNLKINEKYLNEKERIIKFYDFFEATTINHLMDRAPKFLSIKDRNLLKHIKKDPNKLSPQEARTLNFWTRGYTVKQIALLINLSPRTVETYIERTKTKLGCKYKTEIIEKYYSQDY